MSTEIDAIRNRLYMGIYTFSNSADDIRTLLAALDAKEKEGEALKISQHTAHAELVEALDAFVRLDLAGMEHGQREYDAARSALAKAKGDAKP